MVINLVISSAFLRVYWLVPLSCTGAFIRGKCGRHCPSTLSFLVIRHCPSWYIILSSKLLFTVGRSWDNTRLSSWGPQNVVKILRLLWTIKHTFLSILEELWIHCRPSTKCLQRILKYVGQVPRQSRTQPWIN